MTSGAGQPQTRERIRAWFGCAAEAGDAVAQLHYGLCLAEGLGGARDEVAALRWLRRSADHTANAQYWYGRMLVEGRGAAPDPVTGKWWIARAAENGFPNKQATPSRGCASAA
jgi:TPR repeat protein